MTQGIFNGQVALVTGAGGGIGLATAKAFAEAGASVVLADRDEEAIGKATEEVRSAGHSANGISILLIIIILMSGNADSGECSTNRSLRTTPSAALLALFSLFAPSVPQ